MATHALILGPRSVMRTLCKQMVCCLARLSESSGARQTGTRAQNMGSRRLVWRSEVKRRANWAVHGLANPVDVCANASGQSVASRGNHFPASAPADAECSQNISHIQQLLPRIFANIACLRCSSAWRLHRRFLVAECTFLRCFFVGGKLKATLKLSPGCRTVGKTRREDRRAGSDRFRHLPVIKCGRLFCSQLPCLCPPSSTVDVSCPSTSSSARHPRPSSPLSLSLPPQPFCESHHTLLHSSHSGQQKAIIFPGCRTGLSLWLYAPSWLQSFNQGALS